MPRITVERFIVGLIIIAAIHLSLSQTMLYLMQTPEGFTFPLIHNFVEDYYQYLDIMRQGYDGWWTATSRMTPEIYPRMVVSLFLLLLGHVARIFSLSLPVVYTIARVGGGIALMILVYQLIRQTFTPHQSDGAGFPQSFTKRFVALCFVLFSTYFWGWGANGPVVASLTHAWTELDPIFRWSFVPHHLASKVGMLAVFLLLLRSSFSVSHSPFAFFVLPLTIFLAGMTNPVVYATLMPVVGLWFLLEFFRDKTFRTNIHHMAPWFLVGVISGGVLLYHRYLQTNIFPWTSYLLWEQTLLYKVNPFDYVLSLGPSFVLFILAIPTIWRLGRVGSLLIAWAASSWIMLYIVGPFVPVTPERFLGGYQFIPLGIGATIWLFSLKRRGLFRLGIVALLLCYFVVGLFASFREHAGYVAGNRNNPQVYVPNDLMETFEYLSQNSKPEDVVMAPYEISTMIPGLTGRRVVAGHIMFTQDVGAKRAAINEFFTTRESAAINRILSFYDVKWILTDVSWIPPQNSGVVKRFNNKTHSLYTASN